jgi:hypothetical protein
MFCKRELERTFMMALTATPSVRFSFFTLSLVMEATMIVPLGRRISTLLLTAPSRTLATSPGSTLRALTFIDRPLGLGLLAGRFMLRIAQP